MKAQNSASVPEKIEVAQKRINELKTLINHWQGGVNSFWESECYKNPSSPSCLLFDN